MAYKRNPRTGPGMGHRGIDHRTQFGGKETDADRRRWERGREEILIHRYGLRRLRWLVRDLNRAIDNHRKKLARKRHETIGTEIVPPWRRKRAR